MINDLWYKNAVIYCLSVGTFMDADGDGIGDFAGLERRLDYLQGLGVTAVWLMPFQPSPKRDGGYDIADYYGVDPDYGSLGDFVAFTHAAKQRGLRVLIDLVVNHTSDQHRWFKSARADPDSPYRDWYVWSKERPANAAEGMVFPGVQKTTWSWDEAAGAYYFHRFFDFQPDLNTANPAVLAEILKIMGFWIELGVSGFRMDAVPFVIARKGADVKGEPVEQFDMLRDFREFLQWRKGDAIILAEANILPKQDLDYFGDDADRAHMMFNFQVNQATFYGLAAHDARPLVKAIARTKPRPLSAQWGIFLRNHDELDLGRLTERQRQTVFEKFGPEKGMQLYDRGIRRRFAPMLDGDPRRIRMAYSLMFTLPGTPVLRYGDEIGMGDDLALKERDCARTPMQWTPEAQGGFTRSATPTMPPIDHGPLRPCACQRRRPAPRRGLAPQLDAEHHPPAEGSAGDRLGRRHRPGDRPTGRPGAPLRLARQRRALHPQPRTRPHRGRPGDRHPRAGRPPADRPAHRRAQRGGRRRAPLPVPGGLRLSLVPGRRPRRAAEAEADLTDAFQTPRTRASGRVGGSPKRDADAPTRPPPHPMRPSRTCCPTSRTARPTSARCWPPCGCARSISATRRCGSA